MSKSESESVEKVAHLACLKLDPLEVDSFQKNFDNILQYFNSINEIETDGIVPMVTPHNEHPSLRRDEVIKDLSVEEILSNAPDIKDSLFKVPPVV